jgi:hypothetical protein
MPRVIVQFVIETRLPDVSNGPLADISLSPTDVRYSPRKQIFHGSFGMSALGPLAAAARSECDVRLASGNGH